MKKTLLVAMIGLAAASCQMPVEEGSDVSATFEANCETVRAILSDFQNEVADYIHYSDEFISAQTNMNPTGDSTNLEEFKSNRPNWWAKYDAELLTDLRLLPGVNPQTNEVDGSVRYYGQWKVTKSATDSTEATSVVIPLYSSFDFDADGKLLYQQNYGDFTAAFTALNE